MGQTDLSQATGRDVSLTRIDAMLARDAAVNYDAPMSTNAWFERRGFGSIVAPAQAVGIDPQRLMLLSESELAEIDPDERIRRDIWLRARTTMVEEMIGVPETATPPDRIAPGGATYYHTYPSFIADGIAHFETETDPVLKLWSACDTVELTLRFLVFLALGDLTRTNSLNLETLAEIWPRIEEPTLGKWEGMALALGNAVADNGEIAIAPEMPGFVEQLAMFLDGPGRRGEATIENSFAQLRNQLAHGGGITKTMAAKLLVRWGDPFEEQMRSAEFLSEIVCVARRNDELMLLRGPGHAANSAEDSLVATGGSGTAAANLEAHYRTPVNIVAMREGKSVPLWPFGLYGSPEHSSIELDAPPEAVPQIYVRYGTVRLQYTCVGSEVMPTSETDEIALAEFERLLRYDRKKSIEQRRSFEVRGFEEEISRDAAKLIGREHDLSRIVEVIERTETGVIWMTGEAGIGKSFVVSRVAQLLIDEPSTKEHEAPLVLPYRFKLGDDRCNRQSFLTFAIERLRTVVDNHGHRKKSKQPIDRLKALLSKLEERRVYFVLDGIDEIIENDSRFAEDLPLALSFPGVVWFCAGRPSSGLDRTFSSDRCIYAFEEGLSPFLPRMSASDIRAMIIEKIGPLRKRLVIQDVERDGRIVNPFIEDVVDRADGLPIYVTYIIGDILANRFSRFDGSEQLPPTIAKYHAKSLARIVRGIGPIQQMLTPLIATLAAIQEPIQLVFLTRVMMLRQVLDPESDGPDLVEDGLSIMGSLIKKQSTPDEADGFTLFHTSLRQFIESDTSLAGPMRQARHALYEACACLADLPDTERGYPLRHVAHHYLEEDDVEGLIALITHADDADLPALLESSLRAVAARLPRIQSEGDSAPVARFVRELSRVERTACADLLADIFELAFPYGGQPLSLFLPVMERCLDWCSPAKGVQASLRMNTALTSGGSGSDDPKYLNQAEKLSRDPQAQEMRPMVLLQLAFREDAPTGLRYVDEAHELAFTGEDRMMQWEVCFNEGRYKNIVWDFAGAEHILDHGVSIFRSEDQPLRVLWSRGKRAGVLLRVGKLLESVRCFEANDELLAKYFSDARSSVHARQDEYRGWIAFLSGSPASAADLLARIYSEYVAMERKDQVRTLCRLINGCLEHDLIDRAGEYEQPLTRAIEDNIANVSWHVQIWALQTLGRLLGYQRRFEQAERELDRADELARTMKEKHYRLITGFYRADLLRIRGNRRRAVREGLGIYREISETGDAVILRSVARLLDRSTAESPQKDDIGSEPELKRVSLSAASFDELASNSEVARYASI